MKVIDCIITFRIVGLLFLHSCTSMPKEVTDALALAGDNRRELENVIQHYSRSPKDSLRLRAAYFLIRNMPLHYSLYGPQITDYETSLELIGSVSKEQRSRIWDSLAYQGFAQTTSGFRVVSDIEKVSGELLIENIDYSFRVWEEMPWGNQINFQEFCEFILPYRHSNEQVQSWRPAMYKKYRKYIDTLKSKDPAYIFNHIRNFNEFEADFEVVGNANFPMALSLDQLRKSKSGSCDDLCNLNLMALRSIGIPVSIDGTSWANSASGHAWNVLMIGRDESVNTARTPEYSVVADSNTSGNFVPLLRTRTTAMILRTYFRPQGKTETLESLASPWSRDIFTRDVSGEYFDLKCVEVKTDIKEGVGYLYLFTPYGFRPIRSGTISDSVLQIHDVVPGIVYFPMVKLEGMLKACGSAFLLEKGGLKRDLEPLLDSLRTVKIFRKNPLFGPLYNYALELEDSRIEGSNDEDFKNFDVLGRIKTAPLTMTYINIASKEKYRYVRLKTLGLTQIAELQFFGLAKNDKIEKVSGKIISSNEEETDHPVELAFDGSWASYCDLGKEKWLGIDLGRPTTIVKVGYCPRSDTNMIIPGHLYELFYWNGNWVSLGKAYGVKEYLSYENVPKNAILWLRNHTTGKEERIFTIDNQGFQVFW